MPEDGTATRREALVGRLSALKAHVYQEGRRVRDLARRLKWLILTVGLLVIEIVAAIVFWPANRQPMLTDILTLLLVMVTTIYVGFTYRLWGEAQRLRVVQFHPELEISFFRSVDAFDVPEWQRPDLRQEYLDAVSPGASVNDSDIELRYDNLRLKNVGHGQIAEITLLVDVAIKGRPSRRITLPKLTPHLGAGEDLYLTMLQFEGLPDYDIRVVKLTYADYFDAYTHYHGESTKKRAMPHSAVGAIHSVLFHEDFSDVPFGKGWRLDAWSPAFGGPPSALMITIQDRQMRLQGEPHQYVNHYRQQGVAYIDLVNLLKVGRSYLVQCEVRSEPGTTAMCELWCHDLQPEGMRSVKSRQTAAAVPPTDWSTLEVVYTATQSPHLRVHLRYEPGKGGIYVRDVKVFELLE